MRITLFLLCVYLFSRVSTFIQVPRHPGGRQWQRQRIGPER
jgi:hypothetical protein